MDKIVISVDDMANILMNAFRDPFIVMRNYCDICSEINGACSCGSWESCPYDEIVKYRYFVRSNFRKFMQKTDY